jgi:hypothetical protein
MTKVSAARRREDQRRRHRRRHQRQGRFGAIFWVKPTAVAKAAKALGAK